MQIGDFLKRMWRRIVQQQTLLQSPPQPASPMMKAMLMGLAQTRDLELSCDEVFEMLDVFAELINQGEDAAGLLPLVQQHLDMCPDCYEEYEALLASMQATNI